LGDFDVSSGVYTIEPEFISGKTDVTSADADYMLIWDATDSALKKVSMDEVRGGHIDFKSFTLDSPTDSDNKFMFVAQVALTVTSVTGIVEDATSAVLTLQECDSAGDNCSTIEAVTADVDGTISTSIDNAGIDAGDVVRVDVGTVTGTVGSAHVTVAFTKND
jgi:hypothetical protein